MCIEIPFFRSFFHRGVLGVVDVYVMQPSSCPLPLTSVPAGYVQDSVRLPGKSKTVFVSRNVVYL